MRQLASDLARPRHVESTLCGPTFDLALKQDKHPVGWFASLNDRISCLVPLLRTEFRDSLQLFFGEFCQKRNRSQSFYQSCHISVQGLLNTDEPSRLPLSLRRRTWRLA